MKGLLAVVATMLVAAGLLVSGGCRKDEPQDSEDVRQSMRERARRQAHENSTFTIGRDGQYVPRQGAEPKDTDVTLGELQQSRIAAEEEVNTALPDGDDELDRPLPGEMTDREE